MSEKLVRLPQFEVDGRRFRSADDVNRYLTANMTKSELVELVVVLAKQESFDSKRFADAVHAAAKAWGGEEGHAVEVNSDQWADAIIAEYSRFGMKT